MRLCNYREDSSGLDFVGLQKSKRLYALHEVLSFADPFARISGMHRPEKSDFSFTVDAELIQLLDHWIHEFSLAPDRVERCKSLNSRGITFLPPCNPVVSFRDFYAFESHVKTARAARGLEMVPEWYDFPVFYFSNPRCIIAHEEPLTMPTHGKWLDYELEVAAVIGTECRDVPADDAGSVIAGYTILNDWSLRDLQREEVKVGLGPAKGKDFATSLGPYLVTPDELERRRSSKGFDLQMVARVNGVELSRGNWKDIHYSFGELIARASEGVTLYPGEVIGSGTVGTGCILELGADSVATKLGRDNGWLQDGDTVELEVEGLGTLKNEIIN